MGYNTYYDGEFKFKNPLTEEQLKIIDAQLPEDILTMNDDGIKAAEMHSRDDMVEELEAFIKVVTEQIPDFELEGEFFCIGDGADDYWKIIIDGTEVTTHSMSLYEDDEVKELKKCKAALDALTNDKTDLEVITAVLNRHDYHEGLISKYLATKKQIALFWSCDDVRHIRGEADGLKLTEEQCWEVLQLAVENHDASIGISWDVLEIWADEVEGRTENRYVKIRGKN